MFVMRFALPTHFICFPNTIVKAKQENRNEVQFNKYKKSKGVLGYREILVSCFVRCILRLQHLNDTNKYCFSRTRQLTDPIDEKCLLFQE